MAEMLDCLLNYFSGDTNEEGMPRKYVCYHIVGGPGITEIGGLAAITVLAANHAGVWESCERFHAVKVGGPAAALAKALRYLDAFHDDSYMRKVQTETRSLACHAQSFGPSADGENSRGTLAAPRMEPMVILAQLEAGEPMVVLDARSEKAWQASDLHVGGDIRVDRQHLQVDPAWTKDELIVVYCTCPHDAGAAEIAGRLREQGFTRAYVMHGGLEAWQAADGPVVPK